VLSVVLLLGSTQPRSHSLINSAQRRPSCGFSSRNKEGRVRGHGQVSGPVLSIWPSVEILFAAGDELVERTAVRDDILRPGQR
jgi:hypothetical protein